MPWTILEYWSTHSHNARANIWTGQVKQQRLRTNSNNCHHLPLSSSRNSAFNSSCVCSWLALLVAVAVVPLLLLFADESPCFMLARTLCPRKTAWIFVAACSIFTYHWNVVYSWSQSCRSSRSWTQRHPRKQMKEHKYERKTEEINGKTKSYCK